MLILICGSFQRGSAPMGSPAASSMPRFSFVYRAAMKSRFIGIILLRCRLFCGPWNPPWAHSHFILMCGFLCALGGCDTPRIGGEKERRNSFAVHLLLSVFLMYHFYADFYSPSFLCSFYENFLNIRKTQAVQASEDVAVSDN